MKTVLIIDDEPDYRCLLVELLEQNGWRVLQASNGEEGLQQARTHLPAAIICDLLIPRGSGLQVCNAVRNDPALAHTKIIVCSGRDLERDRWAALEAGASEFLPKPFEPRQLLRALSETVAAVAPGTKTSAQPLPDTPPATWLTFWGVRGSIPTPGPTTVHYGGNTSCVEVRAAGQMIILDAGTGLRLLGRKLAAESNGQALELTLLLTHTHWDHIQGLPFFLPVYEPQNRLRILGYEGARHGLEAVLSSQMERPFFPIGLRDVPANLSVEEFKTLSFSLGAVKVDACLANHPGTCVGYRLQTCGGSLAYFPDNEPRVNHQPFTPALPAPSPGQPQSQTVLEFVRGVDVLIMDTQYDREEYQQHVGWGHGCLDDAVDMALAASVKRLFLFHHDPEHDDAKISAMVAQARQLVAARNGSLKVEAAREGLTFELA